MSDPEGGKRPKEKRSKKEKESTNTSTTELAQNDKVQTSAGTNTDDLSPRKNDDSKKKPNNTSECADNINEEKQQAEDTPTLQGQRERKKRKLKVQTKDELTSTSELPRYEKERKSVGTRTDTKNDTTNVDQKEVTNEINIQASNKSTTNENAENGKKEKEQISNAMALSVYKKCNTDEQTQQIQTDAKKPTVENRLNEKEDKIKKKIRTVAINSIVDTVVIEPIVSEEVYKDEINKEVSCSSAKRSSEKNPTMGSAYSGNLENQTYKQTKPDLNEPIEKPQIDNSKHRNDETISMGLNTDKEKLKSNEKIDNNETTLPWYKMCTNLGAASQSEIKAQSSAVEKCTMQLSEGKKDELNEKMSNAEAKSMEDKVEKNNDGMTGELVGKLLPAEKSTAVNSNDFETNIENEDEKKKRTDGKLDPVKLDHANVDKGDAKKDEFGELNDMKIADSTSQLPWYKMCVPPSKPTKESSVSSEQVKPVKKSSIDDEKHENVVKIDSNNLAENCLPVLPIDDDKLATDKAATKEDEHTETIADNKSELPWYQMCAPTKLQNELSEKSLLENKVLNKDDLTNKIQPSDKMCIGDKNAMTLKEKCEMTKSNEHKPVAIISSVDKIVTAKNFDKLEEIPSSKSETETKREEVFDMHIAESTSEQLPWYKMCTPTTKLKESVKKSTEQIMTSQVTAKDDDLAEKKQSTEKVSSVNQIVTTISSVDEQKVGMEKSPIVNSKIDDPWYQMCTPKGPQKTSSEPELSKKIKSVKIIAETTMAPDAFQGTNEDELDEKKQSTVDNIAKISNANEENAKQDEIDRMPIDNSTIHHPWYQMCCSTPMRQKKSSSDSDLNKKSTETIMAPKSKQYKRSTAKIFPIAINANVDTDVAIKEEIDNMPIPETEHNRTSTETIMAPKSKVDKKSTEKMSTVKKISHEEIMNKDEKEKIATDSSTIDIPWYQMCSPTRSQNTSSEPDLTKQKKSVKINTEPILAPDTKEDKRQSSTKTIPVDKIAIVSNDDRDNMKKYKMSTSKNDSINRLWYQMCCTLLRLQKTESEARFDASNTKKSVPKRYVIVFMCTLATIITYAQQMSFHMVLLYYATDVKIVKMSHHDDDSIQCLWSVMEQSVLLSVYYIGFALGYFAFNDLNAIWKLLVGSLLSCISTLMIARLGTCQLWYVLSFRYLTGICTGIVISTFTMIITSRAFDNERPWTLLIFAASSHIGTVVGAFFCGMLTYHCSWPIALYTISGMGIIACLILIWFFNNTPDINRLIKLKEMRISDAETGNQSSSSPSMPWSQIILERPFWAIMFGQFGHGWFLSFILTLLPTYMFDVLGMRLDVIGYVQVLPWSMLFLCIFVLLQVVSYQMTALLWTARFTRIFYMTIGCLMSTMFLLMASFVNDNGWLFVLFISLATAFKSADYVSVYSNISDLTDIFASKLTFITNGASILACIMVPIVVGWMVPNRNLFEWRVFFWISGAVMCISSAMFSILCSGQKQSWNISI